MINHTTLYHVTVYAQMMLIFVYPLIVLITYDKSVQRLEDTMIKTYD